MARIRVLLESEEFDFISKICTEGHRDYNGLIQFFVELAETVGWDQLIGPWPLLHVKLITVEVPTIVKEALRFQSKIRKVPMNFLIGALIRGVVLYYGREPLEGLLISCEDILDKLESVFQKKQVK